MAYGKNVEGGIDSVDWSRVPDFMQKPADAPLFLGEEIEEDVPAPQELEPLECSTWELDKARYTCESVPECCPGFVGAGIRPGAVQCVPADWLGPNNYPV